MPENKPAPVNGIKLIALAALLAGTFLFFRPILFPEPDWETLRKSAVEQYKLGNLEKAERHLLSALEVAEQFPEEDPRFHQALRDMIEIYNLRSKFKDTERILLRLIALDEKLLGAEHPNVAASLNNLAEIYRIQGEIQKADAAYQRSISILETRFGPDHELVAHVRKGYHRFLLEVGKFVPEEARTTPPGPERP